MRIVINQTNFKQKSSIAHTLRRVADLIDGFKGGEYYVELVLHCPNDGDDAPAVPPTPAAPPAPAPEKKPEEKPEPIEVKQKRKYKKRAVKKEKVKKIKKTPPAPKKPAAQEKFEGKMGERAQRIIAAIKAGKIWYTDIAGAAGINAHSLGAYLAPLVKKGLVEKLGDGKYGLPGKVKKKPIEDEEEEKDDKKDDDEEEETVIDNGEDELEEKFEGREID